MILNIQSARQPVEVEFEIGGSIVAPYADIFSVSYAGKRLDNWRELSDRHLDEIQFAANEVAKYEVEQNLRDKKEMESWHAKR